MPLIGNLYVLALVSFAFVAAEQNQTSVPLHAMDLQRDWRANTTASPARPTLLRLILQSVSHPQKPKEHKGDNSTGRGEDKKTEPEDKKREPEDKKREPENMKKTPEDMKRELEDKKKTPEDMKREPEDKKTEPVDIKREPEDKKKEPEDNIDPAVRTRKEGCKIFYWKSWTAC